MSGHGDEAPSPDELAGVFHVAAVDRTDGTVRYFGEPLVRPDAVVETLRPQFAQSGYSLSLERQPHSPGQPGGGAPTQPATGPPVQPAEGGFGPPQTQQYALVAEPNDNGGIPWLNVVLLVATVASTLFVGASSWYYIPVTEQPLRIFEAWPFVVAMLGVLGIHELGHYAAARYHGVDVTLPYFIPFPSLLGTMGAVINIRGRIPSRKALFDIGVAGPLAGLVATVVVTVVGFTLDPIAVPERVRSGGAEYAINFHDPLLMQALEAFVTTLGVGTAVGPGEAVHPVVFAGWAGMFFTFLNLLPVGQLDGGHMVRAMLGPRQETVAALVPGVLFGIAAYLHFWRGLGLNESVGLWTFWGVFAAVIAFNGPANPTDEEGLGLARLAVGIATFAVGALCFLLVPIQVIGA